ncbi:MAG TPA: hypothetical protein PK177_12195, partial [Burkholderiaceae bacterium]|nr:hypothetical protein [Burkholderiaceae bacterium]
AFALASPLPVPAELALLRKSWLSLSGVIADLAPELSPDFPLLDVGLRRFFVELPARMLALPNSRDFATHLSNADIAAAGSGWGFVWLRWWTRLAAIAARRAGHSEHVDNSEHSDDGASTAAHRQATSRD